MSDKPDQVVIERFVRHGFARRPAQTVVEATRLTTAIQAQEPAAARLGVRARSAGTTEADVLAAIETDRSVVRTWLMRATIHLVAASDVRWLTALLGPAFARKFRKRWIDLGLTEEVLAGTAQALPDVLSAGPLTRHEIMAGLCDHGIAIDGADESAAHVLLHATGLGLVCRGPERGRDATFALLDQWVPEGGDGPRGDEALALLARRFFQAFSPATAADFTTWSGLASTAAIALIRDELTSVEVAGRAAYSLGVSQPQRGVRLVPGFDNFLVGYRDRDLIIDPALRDRVFLGGIIRPTVLRDGRVIGTWRLSRKARRAEIEVTYFAPISRALRIAVDAEGADIERFIGQPTDMRQSG
ncbi:MAG: winged helix DNA-binding domain-containing protein [Actinomycetota bacterium]|nr:winged helix DNA-binding domain-containing protein [Actinomycetota bacterium]